MCLLYCHACLQCFVEELDLDDSDVEYSVSVWMDSTRNLMDCWCSSRCSAALAARAACVLMLLSPLPPSLCCLPPSRVFPLCSKAC